MDTAGQRKLGFARIGQMAGNAAADVRRRILRYRVYRATWLELKRLSDRELSDLGLSRNELRDLARDAANRA